jgi:hypothetical protein
MANSVRPNYTARPGEAIRVFRTANGDFAIGMGRITIAATDMRFVADVVADLGRIVSTAEGERVIQQGDGFGHRIVITKPDPPTEPRNAWIVPEDLTAAAAAGLALGEAAAEGGARVGTGTGCGSTIVYEPADWPWPGVRHSPSSEAVLTTLLRQANRNAAGTSDPAAPDWGERG